MNLVEQIARMIDAEGAYSEWYENTSDGIEPAEPTTRQKYYRAKYESKAVDILRTLMRHDQRSIRQALIDFEKEGWKKYGIDVDALRMSKVVEDKYK